MLYWVLKLSKFCNLRCAYCYEWDELDDRRRMTDDLLARTMIAIRDHHELGLRRHGSEKTMVVLHGGEPLASPLEYLEKVMATWRRVMGGRADLQIALQTNLYRLTDAHLEFLERHALGVGVSFDLVPGVRRSLSGRETEAAVMRNMDRLRARGIAFGAICVLARHTAPRLRDVYSFFAERAVSMRILPLSDGPAGRPDVFSLSHREIHAALQDLFVHWIEAGRPIAVAPFDRYLDVAVRKLAGLHGATFSRRADGERILVVNTDGRVLRNDDLDEPIACIGDLSTQSYAEILASEQRERSLRHDEAMEARVCGGCAYRGACSGVPLLESKHGGLHEGRCAIAHAMHAFVEGYLVERGFTGEELREIIEAA